jgi:hypothetical protein
MTKTAAAPEKAPAVPFAAPDKPVSDWTPAELLAGFPKAPSRPIEMYTTTDLVAMKNLGPATLGAELYLAAQACSNGSGNGILGPAILSKGSTPVPFVSEAA